MKLETSETILHLCVGASESWYTFQKFGKKIDIIIVIYSHSFESQDLTSRNGNFVFFYHTTTAFPLMPI